MFNNVGFGQFIPTGPRSEPVRPGPGWRAQMAESARILARLAASRPNNHLTPSELMDMAANRDGDYSAPVQQAARSFFDNRRAVYAAHEQNRRRAFHNRPHHGGARRCDESDLLGMGDIFSDRNFESGADCGRHDSSGGGGGGGHRHASRGHRSPFENDVSYEEALKGMFDHMRRRSHGRGPRRASMSLDGLLSMDRGGHPAAGRMMDHWSRLSGLIERSVEGEMRLFIQDLERELAGLGVAMDDPSDDFVATGTNMSRADQDAEDAAVRAAGPFVTGPDEEEIDADEEGDEEEDAERERSRQEAAEASLRRRELLHRRRILEEDRERRRRNSHGAPEGGGGGGVAAAAVAAAARQDDDIRARNRIQDDLLREQRRLEDVRRLEIERTALLDEELRRRNLDGVRLVEEDLEQKRLDIERDR